MDKLESKPWFYEIAGKRIGPVSEEDMIEMIKAMTISYGNKIWKNGYPDWVSLENSELNVHLANTPPPLSGGSVNNTVVWILAFAPVISALLITIIVAIVNSGDPYRMAYMMSSSSGSWLWLITLVLNIGLSFCDEINLKKAGIDTSTFKGWIWIVPVYLYQRSQALKQNSAYFIVWIVCFLASCLII